MGKGGGLREGNMTAYNRRLGFWGRVPYTWSYSGKCSSSSVGGEQWQIINHGEFLHMGNKKIQAKMNTRPNM